MKAIIISQEDFDDAFKLFLAEVEKSLKSNPHETPMDHFRSVNYYACEFKARIEKK